MINKFQEQITISGDVVKGRFDDFQYSLRKTSKSGAVHDLGTEIKKVSKKILVVISMIFVLFFVKMYFFRSRFDAPIKADSSYKSTQFYFFKK